jgi:[acyl-carrier-protein] S-malonyltransferase
MRVAWLFPGQGSQYPGMGRDLYQRSPAARAILQQAEEVCGQPLHELCLHGPDARLRQCDVLEPALTALALAYAGLLHEHGLEPSCVAGYSAGEVAALCCAGVYSLTDALHLAAIRGRVLHEESSEAARMVAVARLPADAVAQVVDGLKVRGPIAMGAWNAADHTTVVGEQAVVAEAERQFLALGAEVSAIEVAGPWHCDLAAGAARRVRERIGGIEFRRPRIPVYTSATGRQEDDPERLRDGLAEQICRPVRWREAVVDLVRRGVSHLVEVGPGRVLYGFWLREAQQMKAACHGHFLERENGRPVAVDRLAAALGPGHE